MKKTILWSVPLIWQARSGRKAHARVHQILSIRTTRMAEMK
jgi:hypothetical protein